MTQTIANFTGAMNRLSNHTADTQKMNKLVHNQLVADVNTRLSQVNTRLDLHAQQGKQLIDDMVSASIESHLDVSVELPKANELATQIDELKQTTRKIEVITTCISVPYKIMTQL